MPPSVPIALAAGIASALLYASMLVLGPLLGAVPWFVSSVPLILAGLTLGRGAGLLACAAGVVAFALMSLSVVAGLLYLVSDTLPALVILSLALRPAPGVPSPQPSRPEDWYPPGEILARLALVPPVLIVGAALLAPAHEGGLTGFLGTSIGGALQQALSASGQDVLDPETRDAVVRNAVMLLPGMLAMSWLVRAVVAGALAQAIARRMGRALRPSPVYIAMQVPAWSGVLFGIVAILAVLFGGDLGYVAWSVAMGLSLPFMLLGFKLVHAVARRTPYPGMLLGVFYVVFLSVSALAIVAMVLAGLVEFLANLRRRAAGGASEE
ncbi:DUF2232 domain-containing protein [Roseospira navarrensis]|uniref:DUF2232 domain-containing protein n=1 Tax=Roseospira navarrensis TaxID=140058 RepID=A0A7X1ZAX5_9PROT|nr:DUF2232 domain-containing protein [Roseospira navarrensis]MQX35180.1 DUF2232 domain-containing protein [Roseospira navarrensis]